MLVSDVIESLYLLSFIYNYGTEMGIFREPLLLSATKSGLSLVKTTLNE